MDRKIDMFTRGVCLQCGQRPQVSKGKKEGKTVYRAVCHTCHARKYQPHRLKRADKRKRPYRYLVDFESLTCVRCGFVAQHKCQLDVHHIDHNHNNNRLDNLEIICANCHRLEHIQD